MDQIWDSLSIKIIRITNHKTLNKNTSMNQMNEWVDIWMDGCKVGNGGRKTLLHSRMPSNKTEGSMEL